MWFRQSALSGLLVACLAAPAAAQTVGDVTLGSGLSLFGPTVEGTYQLEPTLRLRGIGIAGLSYDDTEEDDDGNTYDIDLSIAAAAILLDHYPDGGPWRLSGGFLINLSDLEATGTGPETEPFEINGQVFDGGEVFGEAEFSRNIAPMVTVGYDYDLGNDWFLSGEVGAIYTGGFRTTLTANSDPLQAEVDANEDFNEVRDDGRDINLLPYIGISVSYRF